MRGIYRLDGDTLTICFGDTRPNRPTEFRTGADTGPLMLATLRRAKQDVPGNPKKATGAKPVAVPDLAVLQPLREAVAARTRSRDVAKQRFDAGVINELELLKAQVELVEARIKLSEAAGDDEALAVELEQLVAQRQKERDLTAERVKVGINTEDSLSQADARLAEAKARLGKVKPAVPRAVAPPPRPRQP
jgi:outer membrane protein TolC